MPDEGELVDKEGIYQRLEKGMLLTRVTKKKKEEGCYRVRLESRQIVMADKLKEIPRIDLRELVEVRRGKMSKDFDRCEDLHVKNTPNNLCFIIMYGTGFNLKSISFIAKNLTDLEDWVKGLEALRKENDSVSYYSLLERWLWKNFYSIAKTNDELRPSSTSQSDESFAEPTAPMERSASVSSDSRSHSSSSFSSLTSCACAGELCAAVKDLKAWSARININIKEKSMWRFLKEQKSAPHLQFKGFKEFFNSIIHDPIFFDNFLKDHFPNSKITQDDFHDFLANVQKEKDMPHKTRRAQKIMSTFLDYIARDNSSIYFERSELVDFLFSDHNSIWCDSSKPNDMTQPLSSYWINSSHNTYLTGDQIASDSSCDAYARALMQGCRCVELDCWNGEREPVIYHGRTLTSKVKLRAVLTAIRDYAFAASCYPVILSIEDHCDVYQQKLMANMFVEILGDHLLTRKIDHDALCLPSPEDLKFKIIIKHKKLPEVDAASSGVSSPALRGHGSTSSLTGTAAGEESDEDDMLNSVCNGRMYIEDPVNKIWVPHFFVLTTENRLSFMEDPNGYLNEEDADLMDYKKMKLCASKSSIKVQRWYHGNISRENATAWILQNSHLGEGAFLVRQSQTYGDLGEYSLSLYREGFVHHVRIPKQSSSPNTEYYSFQNSELRFPDLCQLINYYQNHELHSANFSIQLGQPVPHNPTTKRWYHEELNRKQAEDMLSRIPHDGAFLVRAKRGAGEEAGFVLSFRLGHPLRIRHCQIVVEDHLFMIGDTPFESLVDLVNHYGKYPLYGKMRLRYPVNMDLVNRIGHPVSEAASSEDLSTYDDLCEIQRFSARPWSGGQRCAETSPFGELETDSVPLNSLCTVTEMPARDGKEFIFRLICRGERPGETRARDFACDSAEDMRSWMAHLSQRIRQEEEKSRERCQMEKTMRISKELSDLIVYCVAVPFSFNPDNVPRPYFEMSSFSEMRFEKLLSDPNQKGRFSAEKMRLMLRYHANQLGRLYPKGQRVDSSNFDPFLAWSVGVQMVALNFQTPDRAMQLNRGRFRANAGTGYVLQPRCLRDPAYNPADENSLIQVGVDPLTINLHLIGGRFLPRLGRTKLAVEIELLDMPAQKPVRWRSKQKNDNGLCPVWNERTVLDVRNPPIALIRFAVLDEDVFGDANLVGQATFPVEGLRKGIRSVPLENGYGHRLELASLLVHIETFNPMTLDTELYCEVQKISNRIVQLQMTQNELDPITQGGELRECQRRLQDLHEELTRKEKERARSSIRSGVVFQRATLN